MDKASATIHEYTLDNLPAANASRNLACKAAETDATSFSGTAKHTECSLLACTYVAVKKLPCWQIKIWWQHSTPSFPVYKGHFDLAWSLKLEFDHSFILYYIVYNCQSKLQESKFDYKSNNINFV